MKELFKLNPERGDDFVSLGITSFFLSTIIVIVSSLYFESLIPIGIHIIGSFPIVTATNAYCVARDIHGEWREARQFMAMGWPGALIVHAINFLVKGTYKLCATGANPLYKYIFNLASPKPEILIEDQDRKIKELEVRVKELECE